MIFDASVMFANAQAITVTAPSQNVIDLGATGIPMYSVNPLVRDIGKGVPIPLLVQVVQAFAAAGAATLQIAIETDDNAAFATPVQKWISPVTALADLVAGKQFNIDFVPKGVDERYMRLNFIVSTGPMTAGAITAGITMGNQTANI